MMLARVRNYKNYKFTEFEIGSFTEFKTLANGLLGEYINDDFRPGVSLSPHVASVANLSVGVTEHGYIVIANRGKNFNYDQLRLVDSTVNGSKASYYRIRWDEIEEIPSKWLVADDTAKAAIDYWIDHGEICQDLNWEYTE